MIWKTFGKVFWSLYEIYIQDDLLTTSKYTEAITKANVGENVLQI